MPNDHLHRQKMYWNIWVDTAIKLPLAITELRRLTQKR
jgi:uncharacterized membrane protein YfhO